MDISRNTRALLWPVVVAIVAIFSVSLSDLAVVGTARSLQAQSTPRSGVADEFPAFQDNIIPGLEDLDRNEKAPVQGSQEKTGEHSGESAGDTKEEQSDWFGSLFKTDRTLINIGIVILLLILFLFYRIRSGGKSRRSYF